MLLKEMLGKNIRITTPNKSIFTGEVCEYISPEDNESEKGSIVLQMNNGKLIGLENWIWKWWKLSHEINNGSCRY